MILLFSINVVGYTKKMTQSVKKNIDKCVPMLYIVIQDNTGCVILFVEMIRVGEKI